MIDCYKYSTVVEAESFVNSGVSEWMKSINNHYMYTGFNCSCFAIDFFEYATGYNLYNNIFGLTTPAKLKSAMKKNTKVRV